MRSKPDNIRRHRRNIARDRGALSMSDARTQCAFWCCRLRREMATGAYVVALDVRGTRAPSYTAENLVDAVDAARQLYSECEPALLHHAALAGVLS